jgi:adenylate cyclase
MTDQTLDCAVLFADLAGSTQLYETLGDREALRITNGYISHMAAIVERHAGIVVKTIGDEIMCRFQSADSAVQAACIIQQAMSGSYADGTSLSVRIGLHYGSVIMKNDDIFGDAVNIAARMVATAKPGQIIATEETVQRLAVPLRKKARFFDKAAVKGKQDKLNLYEIVWEEQHLTSIIPIDFVGGIKSAGKPPSLTLLFADRSFTLHPSAPPLILGREAQSAELVVPAGYVSRVHASIEYKRGKFVFCDQSTNGSFIRPQQGKAVYLRREEFPLLGEGVISLGAEINEENPYLIYFFSSPEAASENAA